MRLVSVSDLHTCHRRTPTSHILRNLSTLFYTDVDLNDIDLVLITGDVFDRFVDNDNPDFLLTLEWFKQFFKVCKKKNVKVRFTEGTTLHDWSQIQHLMFSVEQGTDVNYFDTVHIETFTDLDNLTVMYVPDNMSDKTPDEIWDLALTTLAANNLKKVDLIALHGGFYWQLPEKARKHAHMEERWQTIVRYGIFSGHIHIPGSWNNIIFSNGSFDRIRHGEEHKKGCWLIDLDLHKKLLLPTFYENKNALPYLTVNVKPDDLPEHIVLTMKRLISSRNYPFGTQFRLLGGSKSVVGPIVSSLNIEYPQFGIVEKAEKDDVVIDEELYQTKHYEGIQITKHNIFGHLEPLLTVKVEGTDITLSEMEALLKEFL